MVVQVVPRNSRRADSCGVVYAIAGTGTGTGTGIRAVCGCDFFFFFWIDSVWDGACFVSRVKFFLLCVTR